MPFWLSKKYGLPQLRVWFDSELVSVSLRKVKIWKATVDDDDVNEEDDDDDNLYASSLAASIGSCFL